MLGTANYTAALKQLKNQAEKLGIKKIIDVKYNYDWFLFYMGATITATGLKRKD